MTVQQMRNIISDRYDSWKWRQRVERMGDNQVIAIYNSLKERNDLKPKKKGKEKYHQMDIWEVFGDCMSDMVNRPAHYQSKSGLEVIDAISKFTIPLAGRDAVDIGNFVKYVCRFKKKNGLQDLEKAQWYYNDLKESLKHRELLASRYSFTMPIEFLHDIQESFTEECDKNEKMGVYDIFESLYEWADSITTKSHSQNEYDRIGEKLQNLINYVKETSNE